MISVIVPVYNVAPYLRRCVRSLLRQTYSNLEILLIDDGSTDNSGKLCDALADTDPRIQVLHQPNGGLSHARNTGMDM
ncbi:MAG: glycosyltransferase family 2 protein, partial [Oscillospiraceae bacterium]|nr:glycosyltransferase family 2 protein [Oscillospiraceae bacterium]